MEAYRDQYARIFRGGDDIVLIAISTDDVEVGKKYGAWRSLPGGGAIDNRTVFVIDGEGVIRYVAAPFREVDPTAYDELAEAIDRIAGPAS